MQSGRYIALPLPCFTYTTQLQALWLCLYPKSYVNVLWPDCPLTELNSPDCIVDRLVRVYFVYLMG